ncbi:cadherin-23-like [Mercenaria mercenaria]|uniref:cadherin-23-like n=1 Tax=Mercenaria mercenaria TaxID=6596 RepID=UPI00234EC355|nr:cadherin-23-like [Mercenaria mercenaria]
MKLEMLYILTGLFAYLFGSADSAGYIEIGNLPATVSVFEEAAGGTFLYSVAFYQSPSVGTVNCGFDSAQPNFVIAAGSGAGQYIVQLATSPSFVYTTTSTYSLDITCTDGTDSSPSLTLTVNLIQNVAPVFTNTPGTVDLSAKTTKANMNVFTLSYTDPDTPSPLPRQAVVSTTPAEPIANFFIFSNDMLKITQDLIDNDDVPQYILEIEVGDEKTTSTVTVTVNINARNTPPEFVNGVNPDETISLPEFTAGRLLVHDIDTYDAEGDTVQMSETTGVAGFELVPATGEVYLLGGVTLDFETTYEYILNVEIEDYIDKQNTSTYTLTINVTNINEQPTFAATPSPVTIEESVNGTVVGTLDQLCTDPDGVPPDTTTYAILFSTESAYFSIDPTTAQVTLAQDYDYDDVHLANEVNLTIRCSDTDGLSDDTTYTITITDINDNNPICSPSVTSFSLTYAQAVSTTLMNVDCSDIDSTVNAELEYSIIGLSTGYAKTFFQVDTSGNVSISTAFTMDYNTSFYVTVLINDKGTNPGPLSATVTLTVTYTERPTITTYEGITECFLCTTSAITLVSAVSLVVFMLLVTCIVLTVLKCCYDRERLKIVKHLSKKKKKSRWRWCGCLRPGALKKKKKSRMEILLAEKRDQEYIRARNALLGVNDEPDKAEDSLRSKELPGPSGTKPVGNNGGQRKKRQSSESINGRVLDYAYMGRDKTPDISATPVDREMLTQSQKLQLEKFKGMKKSVDSEGPSTSKKGQAASGMIWSFEGR